MTSLEDKLKRYIARLRKAADDNLKMSVAPKGKVCSEKHKVVLRNISMEQRRTADELVRLMDT